jgi:hypothetical protein
MGYVLALAVFVGSMFVADYLAHERGWSRHRWRMAAATIGPLAIPLIYLVQAAYAIRKMFNATRA